MTNGELVPVEPDSHCQARQKSGKLCTRPAGAGTDHSGTGRCARHGGAAPQYTKHLQRRGQLPGLVHVDQRREISPFKAVSEEMSRTQGVIDYLDEQLATVEVDPHAEEEFSNNMLFTIRCAQAERDHMMKVAKLARDMGIAEHQAKIDEEQATLMTALLTAVLDDAGLTHTQEIAARDAIAQHVDHVKRDPEGFLAEHGAGGSGR